LPATFQRTEYENPLASLFGKIATVQAERDDEDRVTVVVAVREAPNAEEQARMADRSRLLMDDFWSRILSSGEPDQRELVS
jgi:hypothetical protein